MPYQKLKNRSRPLSEINVVPYIDVMLVLLIIFMVTTPLLKQGIEVQLPQVSHTLTPSKETPIIITIDKAGHYYLDHSAHPKTPLSLQSLVYQVLQAIQLKTPHHPVLIQGDRNASYGNIVQAMAALQKKGVTQLGLITTAKTEK